ncbi:MAG: hypothetical protein E6Q97_29980 [Desulfurellales bacterium]|nr:MAG: hypothetical protein E6Q97_29980 [Desulfurellales bacterium]
MIAFTEFSEDPNARHAVVMINPEKVESCAIGTHKIAHGGTAETLTFTMMSGDTHTVYGSMKDYAKIERLLFSVESDDDVTGFEISDFLAKEISWHESNPDTTLSAEYQKGFIKGLTHAKQIISDMQALIGVEVES